MWRVSSVEVWAPSSLVRRGASRHGGGVCVRQLPPPEPDGGASATLARPLSPGEEAAARKGGAAGEGVRGDGVRGEGVRGGVLWSAVPAAALTAANPASLGASLSLGCEGGAGEGVWRVEGGGSPQSMPGQH